MSDFDRVMCQYDGFKGYSGNPPKNEVEYNDLFSAWGDKPKWADVQTQLANTAYKTQRATAYPSIQEQLDLLYWDKVNGTNNWEAAIEAVKTEYPKP